MLQKRTNLFVDNTKIEILDEPIRVDNDYQTYPLLVEILLDCVGLISSNDKQNDAA